ncbi:TrmB family transcriptional regulator sugar-binding domain-containing protein [Haloarcula marina]|uniref:TrmB family transcriptional regulator sugar-binding domain-containing protein n=1 Tax=Haloarcula marina TaxID=2961574 RepID=UPI0032AE9E3D
MFPRDVSPADRRGSSRTSPTVHGRDRRGHRKRGEPPVESLFGGVDATSNGRGRSRLTDQCASDTRPLQYSCRSRSSRSSSCSCWAFSARWPTESEEAFEATTGTIVDVKQSIVRPFSNEFPTQESFVVELDGERVTVGGSKAFLEDFEATRVTFEGLVDAI